jgi:hypothetical protein
MIHLTDGSPALVNVDVLVSYKGGPWQLHDRGHNLVVNTGLNLIRDRILGLNDAKPITHMAVGTSDVVVTAVDVALGGEVFRDIFTQITTFPASALIRYYLGPNSANGVTLWESGLFNADNVMYARRVFGNSIVKTVNIATTINWTISWSI